MHLRHEYKHRINFSDMLCLDAKLKAICKYDSHSEPDGTYFIKSLYFDNYNDKALREKLDGLNYREKFRIRFYGTDTSYIRLEKKSKINGLCNKVSAPITANQCMKILNADTRFLLSDNNNLFHELYAKMQFQLLRPKQIVAYRRKCFVYPLGNVRVTLDYNISGSNKVYDFLSPNLFFPHTFNTAILEVKWDEYIPSVISDAIQTHCRISSSFSKYAAVRI